MILMMRVVLKWIQKRKVYLITMTTSVNSVLFELISLCIGSDTGAGTAVTASPDIATQDDPFGIYTLSLTQL